MSDAFIKLTYEHGEQFINTRYIRTVDIFKKDRGHEVMDYSTNKWQTQPSWGIILTSDGRHTKEHYIENPEDISVLRNMLAFKFIMHEDDRVERL